VPRLSGLRDIGRNRDAGGFPPWPSQGDWEHPDRRAERPDFLEFVLGAQAPTII
jgi:hypothetical protein